MLQDTLENFTDRVLQFLVQSAKSQKGLLLKKHSENLRTHGEFSYPNTLKSWHEFIDLNDVPNNLTLMEYIKRNVIDITDESVSWELSVSKVKEEKGRVHLFLCRPRAIRFGLIEAINYNRSILNKLQEQTDYVIFDTKEDCNSLTYLRLKYYSKAIENICRLNTEYTIPKIFVTSKSSSLPAVGALRVLCGAIINSKTGLKESSINAEEFIRIRQDEMTLIAQHKYGVRVSTDQKWRDFIAHLGESAVTFELLQTKPSSAVKIDFTCSSAGSSKGASFILYNCARLEAIIRAFNEKVEEGEYPLLPQIEDVDLSLINQEEEWNLIFNFILGLPSLLKQSMDVREEKCEFRPHFICNFLCSLVRIFSQYYRKTRILVEARKHLLPVIFARMHMLIVLNSILKNCLKILNIKSVSQM